MDILDGSFRHELLPWTQNVMDYSSIRESGIVEVDSYSHTLFETHEMKNNPRQTIGIHKMDRLSYPKHQGLDGMS